MSKRGVQTNSAMFKQYERKLTNNFKKWIPIISLIIKFSRTIKNYRILPKYRVDDIV
jgi:hypothetical protein